MRVNVYREEITQEVELVWTEPRPGMKYCGLRFFQKSAAELHDYPGDDDRSAVTFWVGSKDEARRLLFAALDVVDGVA